MIMECVLTISVFDLCLMISYHAHDTWHMDSGLVSSRAADGETLLGFKEATEVHCLVLIVWICSSFKFQMLTNKCYCLILQIKSSDQITQSMLHYWIYHLCIILSILPQLIWKSQNPANCSDSKFLIVFPWKSGKIFDWSSINYQFKHCVSITVASYWLHFPCRTGFGSTIHVEASILAFAMKMGRVMLRWSYCLDSNCLDNASRHNETPTDPEPGSHTLANTHTCIHTQADWLIVMQATKM
jgi:hypothetical protein